MGLTFRTLVAPCLVGLSGPAAFAADTLPSSETRALRYLAAEVPDELWARLAAVGLIPADASA